MSKCKPPYNNANIKAPRLNFSIDSGLSNAEDAFRTKEEIFEYYISELVVRETKDYIPKDKRASYKNTPGGEAVIISSPDGNTEIRLSQDSEWNSIFSVDSIQLDPKLLNKKMGKRLYFKSIEETLKRGGSYLSSGGMTSNMAARVWKSLEKMSKENPKLLNKELLKLGFPQLIGTFEVYSPAREEYKIDSRFEEDNVSLDDYIVIHKDSKGNVESYEQIGSEPVWHAELYHNKYRENLEKLKKDPRYFHKMYKDKATSIKRAEQLLAKKKLKRNWMFMEGGKISSEQRRKRDAQAVEGLYRPYTHIEQEIVRREGLRGDSHIKRWFQNLREKVATGEMSDEQRREVLVKRVNKKLKPPGDDMAGIFK